MKKFFILFAALAAVVMTSCDNNEGKYDSYPPTWKGFQFVRDGMVVSKDALHAGDVVTIIALQDKLGHLINSTYYNWTLSVPVFEEDGVTVAAENAVIEAKPDHRNYDGDPNGKDNPTWKFEIPLNACCGYQTGRHASITFVAKYNYSGNGVQAENEPGSHGNSSLSGNIVPQSGSVAGGARGTVNFNVHNSKCGH